MPSSKYYYEFSISEDARVHVVEMLDSDILSRFRYSLDGWKNGKWDDYLTEERNTKFLEKRILRLAQTIPDRDAFLVSRISELLVEAGMKGMSQPTLEITTSSDPNFKILMDTRKDALMYTGYNWGYPVGLGDVCMFIDVYEGSEDPSHTLIATLKNKVHLYPTQFPPLSDGEYEAYERGERGVANDICW